MAKKKTTVVLSSLLSATLILSACGHDDKDDENKKPKIEADKNNKDQAKKSDKKEDSSSDKREKGKRLTKNKTPKKEDKDEQIRKEHDKNDKRVDNDEANLPDRLQTKNGKKYIEDVGYSSVKGTKDKKEDITDYLRQNKVDNVDDSAPVRIYDKVEKNFKNAYPKVEELANDDIDFEKKASKREEIVDKYFYEEDTSFDRIMQFALNKWKPDYSTLDITYSDQKNTYIWQMSFKNKDGKKVSSMVGYYYDYVDAISLIDGGVTNEGATNAYDNSQDEYSKGSNK